MYQTKEAALITPAYSAAAPERILPAMALDFTSATLDPRITVTRAGNTATRINSSGVIELVNADLPRFDYNPSTLVCKGLLVEEDRSNLLLNSLLNGTNLSTQSVTLSAVPYTLSFYGTGSVAISGGHSATVVGSGAYPARQTYTFTPTAGSTTFTVTGTVQFAQLEAGVFPTSFIPTAGASVIRSSDQVQMTGANFSSWYNGATGAFSFAGEFISGANTESGSFRRLFSVSDGTTNNTIQTVALGGPNLIRAEELIGGAFTAFNTVNTPSGAFGFSLAYAADSQALAISGSTPATSSAAALPTVNRLDIGMAGTGFYQMCGWVAKMAFYKQRIINSEVQAFSK